MEERITSRRNALLQHARKLLSSRSYRESCGEFAAEGTKLLQEAATWYQGLHTVIAQEGVALCALPEHVRLVRVPPDVMQDISAQKSPQGALFLCHLPQEKAPRVRPGCLLVDGVQDPGNLGTILRTADALDVPVILLDGCCDAYSEKTVRASMGAVFRTQPVRMQAMDAVRSCKEQNIPLFVTAMSEDAHDLREVALHEAAVVIGSEGAGVRRMLFDAADETIIIPMSSRCESLNAAIAAAIVMWQMKR